MKELQFGFDKNEHRYCVRAFDYDEEKKRKNVASIYIDKEGFLKEYDLSEVMVNFYEMLEAYLAYEVSKDELSETEER